MGIAIIAVIIVVAAAVLYLKKNGQTAPMSQIAAGTGHGAENKSEASPVETDAKTVLEDAEEVNRFYAPEAQILIVDDEADSRAHIKEILDKLGVQYETAHSGMQCIERAKEKEFHILLISHMMSRMDGVQTLRNLKKTDGNLSIGAAAYALTSDKAAAVQDVYMKEGFDGCLTKPVGEYALTYMLMEQLPSELVTFAGNIKEQTRKAYEAEQLLAEYGVVLAQGINNCEGRVDDYKTAAKAFCDGYDEVHKILIDFLYDDECEQYAVQMEQLKSQAEQVGVDVLTELAASHIEMAQAGDAQALENAWREFTLTWENAIKGLRKWLGLSDTFTNVTEVLVAQTNGIELSDSELGSRLQAALTDMDENRPEDAKQKLAELKQYELAEEVRVFVEITYVALRTGDVDKARSMIQKIM